MWWRGYRWIACFVFPAAKLSPARLAAMLALVIIITSPEPAQARRHCGHGSFYRVSLGQCVSARSRAARGFHHRTGGLSGRSSFRHPARRLRIVIRRHGRHRIAPPEATEPAELPDEVLMKPSPKIQERIERAAKGDREPQAPPLVEDTPEPSIELPVGITGSLLMRPPAPKSFEWLSPGHQHPNVWKNGPGP